MIRFVVLSFLLLFHFRTFSQDTISLKQIERIINFLASDSMKGRANGSLELYKAAQFISSEFQTDSLLYYPGYNSFMQPFVLTSSVYGNRVDPVNVYNVIGVLEGKTKPNEVIIFSAHYDHVEMEPNLHDSIFNGANDN